MSFKFGSSIDLQKNELLNARVQNLASEPSSPVSGQIYFNTTTHLFGYYDGSGWVYGPALDTDGTLSANSDTVVASQKATKTYADTKLPSSYLDTDGTLAANSDSKIASQKATKTYADTKIPSSYLDTDVALTSNSDSKIATQKAIKAYVDGLVVAGLHYMGAIDCSANPNYPAGAKGDVYRISVAGKIGGASGTSVSAGDSIICNTAASSGNEATVGASWDKIQANVEQATTSTLGLVALATSTEAEAKSNPTKAVTAAALANFARIASGTITADSSATDFVITHNLGTRNVIVSIREVSSPYAQIMVDNEATTTNTVTVKFATAPTTGTDYTVTITAI